MKRDELDNKEEYGEVAQLLGRMKRVEAPADFDFRVKARIAGGRPAAGGLFAFPAAVRYAALLAVLLVVGGTAGYYVLDIGKGDIAVKPVSVPPEPNIATNSEPANAEALLADSEPPCCPPDSNGVISPKAEPEAGAIVVKPSANSQDPGGGSGDFGLGPPKQPIYPPGINPGGIRPVKPEGFANSPKIPAMDVLQTLGVNAQIEGNSWKIGSLNPNSTAARVGLQAGDIVDSINDQKITISSSIKNPFTAKTMRIIRDGKTVLIDLAKP